MRCPSCGHLEDRVIDSRSTKEGRAIRRRRECIGCGHRYTTYEYVENASILVVKKDGKREPWSREKVVAGISRACEKRPISLSQIEAIVDRIENEIQRQAPGELGSKSVGELVMAELRELDEVAYVRFASVYRHFKDVNEFLDEIQGLVQGVPKPARPHEQ
ncbi:MAG TPA: transcriptional regulator NrdR [Dongiaceae bacterium]|jgi:transcriptional repressor NrdR|nr:transcriptional regulator NrdR [Dongiaceae bacterium]